LSEVTIKPTFKRNSNSLTGEITTKGCAVTKLRMKAFQIIKDPDAIELLGDETRRRVIYLLRARERTISQMAEELGMTPPAIYHHIKKLLAAGMVEVAKEERIENFIEIYYRATAEVFEFSYGTGRTKEYLEQRLKEALQSLDKLGINVHADPVTISRIVAVQKELEDVGSKPELEDKASKLEGIDFFGKQEISKYAKMISMTDKQWQEWFRLNQEFRDLLRKLVTSPRSKRQNPRHN
jgi:DNA-binding transcriptional ArsR family regulator